VDIYDAEISGDSSEWENRSAGVLSRLGSRLCALSGHRSCDGLGGVVLLAADSSSEVAKSPPKRPADLGEPLGPEHEEGNHENEDQMRWLENVADHV
jgi:hypothetical protein